jgi:hypothetical protein
MSIHPRPRLAIAGVLAGTLLVGALAGPAMAASDDGSASLTVRKSGGDQHEYFNLREAGGVGSNIAI